LLFGLVVGLRGIQQPARFSILSWRWLFFVSARLEKQVFRCWFLCCEFSLLSNDKGNGFVNEQRNEREKSRERERERDTRMWEMQLIFPLGKIGKAFGNWVTRAKCELKFVSTCFSTFYDTIDTELA
jgi:hypothetical protein